jgi:hypothetical protein
MLPKPVVWLASWFDPALELVYPTLGRLRNSTNTKSKLLLGMQYKSSEQAILDCADSLIAGGYVKPSSSKLTWALSTVAVLVALAAVGRAALFPRSRA